MSINVNFQSGNVKQKMPVPPAVIECSPNSRRNKIAFSSLDENDNRYEKDKETKTDKKKVKKITPVEKKVDKDNSPVGTLDAGIPDETTEDEQTEVNEKVKQVQEPEQKGNEPTDLVQLQKKVSANSVGWESFRKRFKAFKNYDYIRSVNLLIKLIKSFR